MPQNHKALFHSSLPLQDDLLLAQNFRHHLRQETRLDHDQLDEMVSGLDIACLRGFRIFVDVHLGCFVEMQKQQSDHHLSNGALSDMIVGLKADAAVISAKPAAAATAILPVLDPLAIDYIVAGSRLGSKVLHKRWATTKDPTVRRANHYFGQISDPLLWHQTCDALSAIPVGSHRAMAIVRDTRILFQFFAAALSLAAEHQDALT